MLLVFQTLGTPTNTAIQQYMNAQEGAAAVRRHRRDQVGRPEEVPLDHGLAARTTRPRPGSTPSTSSRTSRTPRSACSTRTTTTARTTSKGFKDGLGDKADSMIVEELTYEVTDPTVDSQIVSLQEHPAPTSSSTSPRPSSPPRRSARRRHRLEAAALPQQRLDLGRLGAEARGPRQVGRPDHRRSTEGSDRSAVAGRPRTIATGRR